MSFDSSKQPAPDSSERRMVPVALMGQHSHRTRSEIEVHVYFRSGRYLARGSYEGRRFGETLGKSEAESVARLREILVDIDNGVYVRASERRKRPLKTPRRQATARQIIDAFLEDVRNRKGKATFQNYRSRLNPVLDFIERPENRKKWALGEAIDRAFVVALRVFLYQYDVTPNGRPGATSRKMSSRTISNVLECLRTMFSWARRPDVRFLPAEWSNPVTAELVGPASAKDPLRDDPVPLATRIRMVEQMDLWQLCHLTPAFVLPLRPGEAAGLLVSEVDFEKGWFTIGTRFRGDDFTKARTSYKLPFPREIEPLLKACIAGRSEGPLFRRRRAFRASANTPTAEPIELAERFQEILGKSAVAAVRTEQDRKDAFRTLLRSLGGVSTDILANEFERLAGVSGVQPIPKFYALRHATTQGLKDAKISQLDLMYLTAHKTSGILSEYTSVDPLGAMEVYFQSIGRLLAAIRTRAEDLGIFGMANAAGCRSTSNE